MSISSVSNSYGAQKTTTESPGMEYAKDLQKKFSYMNNSTMMNGVPTSVMISKSFLEKCAQNPDKAAYLEENLAAIPGCVSSAKANCLGTITNISYQIDSNGEITAIMSGTNDPDGKIARENAEKKVKEQEAAKRRQKSHKSNSLKARGRSVQDTTETLIRKSRWIEDKKIFAKVDSIKISEEGRLAAEQEKAAEPAAEDDGEEVSESQGGSVVVNEHKRARQIAAAKCQDDVRQVIALLQKDMADCKAGLEKGWCDEAEIAKVQALLNSAQARMSQVPKEAEGELGISEFDLAGLM